MISVVIAGYNCEATIRSTIESVLRQERVPTEIIFVDDGSADETRDIVRKFPQVRLVEQRNQGPGIARNNGASQAKGDYIAFLDSDDLWFPWTLKTFESIISECNQPDLVAGKLLDFSSDRELDAIAEQPLQYDTFSDYYESNGKGYFVGSCNMLVKKSAFERVGGFTTRRIYAEDMDLAMRLGACKRFVQVLSPLTLGYRQHPTSASKNSRLIYEGILNLIHSELRGEYPGSADLRPTRRALITLFARPASLRLVDAGQQALGWRIFRSTIRWHLRQGRWRYLMGFPVLAFRKALTVK